MCGICGIVDRNGPPAPDEALVGRMAATLAHRGPDDRGAVLLPGGPPFVALGHTRLSVIDLSSAGHQPMPNEDGSVWLVFNGEIFNFAELRADLEKRGHRFSSRTDCEVVVHAWEEHGEGCLDRFVGQFAFALWDSRRATLFLARDHTGIKPLYYLHEGGRFAFASELKALLERPGLPHEIDPHGLDDLLTYEFIPSPRTILKGIRKLPPAHRLSLKDGDAVLRRYWEPRYEPVRRPEGELCERLLSVLREAVRSQLVSDVPLGAFLSGGLDSSTVVALMSQTAAEPVRTLSIGFQDRSYDELSYAREVAAHFGTRHEEFILRPCAPELAEKLVRHLDDPIADFSVFPTFLVSQAARRRVTVALTGDGGDEVFGGYDTYCAQRLSTLLFGAARLLGKPPLSRLISSLRPPEKKKGAVNRLKRFAEGMALPADLRHFRWMVFLSERNKRALYTDAFRDRLLDEEPFAPIRAQFRRFAGADGLNRLLAVDLATYLTDNCLVKTDRMSMACALETRVPLLDHRVIEFMASVPPEMKVRGFRRKYLLRRAVAGILPPRILARGKEGFSIPMRSWLRKELQPLMRDLLSEGALRRRGFFRPEEVGRLVTEHLDGRENHAHRLWALMLFEIWAREFVDRRCAPSCR